MPVSTSSTSWEYRSAQCHNTIYIVQLHSEHDCSCSIKCQKCRVCAYAYSCTCMDYILHSTACKHVHAVHILRNDTTMHEAESGANHTEKSRITFQEPTSPILCNRQMSILQSSLIQQAHELLAVAKEATNLDAIRQAKKHIGNAVSVLKAIKPTNSETVFPRKRKIHPMANMETQRRFYSTRNKRKKTSPLLHKPSQAESQEIRAILEATIVRTCSVCLQEDDTEGRDEIVEWTECDICNVCMDTYQLYRWINTLYIFIFFLFVLQLFILYLNRYKLYIYSYNYTYTFI